MRALRELKKMWPTLPGVKEVNVNLATERVKVLLDEESSSWKDVVIQIEKTGYSVPSRELDLNIEGMTCASCVSRIEKVVGRLDGVQSVDVNLATEKAHISYVAGLVQDGELIRAVEKAGYHAKLASETVAEHDKARKERQYKRLVMKFWLAVVLTIPLVVQMLYMMFGGMPFLPAWVSWLLATPVQFYVGWRFYKGAYHALRGGAANMDVLVALGTSVAYLYSVILMLQGSGSAHVYFDTSAMIVTLIFLGKLLEERTKVKTGAAIEALAKLGAKVAHVLRDGREVDVPVELLRVDDVVRVRPGEKVPSDGVLLEGHKRGRRIVFDR